MNQSAVGSFAKFTLGFLVFISLSLGITVAVDSYTEQQDQERQTAAAIKALLKQAR